MCVQTLVFLPRQLQIINQILIIKIYHSQQILSKLSGKKCIVVCKYIKQYVFFLFLTDLLKRKKYNLKFLVTVGIKMFTAKG